MSYPSTASPASLLTSFRYRPGPHDPGGIWTPGRVGPLRLAPGAFRNFDARIWPLPPDPLPSVPLQVGLPGRGKTFLCNKLKCYLNWVGHETRHFNVGQYRRKERHEGEIQDANFFDHNNREARARGAGRPLVQGWPLDRCTQREPKLGGVAAREAACCFQPCGANGGKGPLAHPKMGPHLWAPPGHGGTAAGAGAGAGRHVPLAERGRVPDRHL